MWQEEITIMVRGDYISGSDLRDFLNVGVRYYLVTANHRVILACFLGSKADRTSGTKGTSPPGPL